jgi:hypothetical protein
MPSQQILLTEPCIYCLEPSSKMPLRYTLLMQLVFVVWICQVKDTLAVYLLFGTKVTGISCQVQHQLKRQPAAKVCSG